MSDPPKLDAVVFGALITPELSTSSSHRSDIPSEHEPLLGAPPPRRKPFYRARPLWLVPFAVAAALVRGMTLAPRVEVFTQLACQALHKNSTHTSQHAPADVRLRGTGVAGLSSTIDPLSPYLPNAGLVSLNFISNVTGDEDRDPMTVPSERCMSDSDVQAGAARIQTVMTIIMGSLSALTTGWWGHFGERYGRCRVLALTTLGVLMTDLTFILVSTPSSPLAAHGHKLLILAPIIEGSLGGWSALQAGISAYISDCTSAGSRAHIFSRFTGVFYLGFSVGPSIGGWLIRHSNSVKFFDYLGAMHPDPTRQSVTPVFWVSALASLANLVLIFFVIPESLSKEKQAAARFEYNGEGKGKGRALVTADVAGDESSSSANPESGKAGGDPNFIMRVLQPLGIFLPQKVQGRSDWSLTFLAIALFGYYLSAGIFQIKYLYAVHVYGWSAEVLSYYISFMGGARAVHLLFILPFIISTFKPQPGSKKTKSASTSQASNVGHLTGNNIRYTNIPVPPTKQIPKSTPSKSKSGKPKLTKAHLAREMRFDMSLCRASLMLDITSNVLVMLSPSPAYKVHTSPSISATPGSGSPAEAHSQALFVMASSLTSFGCGFMPAVQSLALCILQARALSSEENADPTTNGSPTSTPGAAPAAGKLFGALAVLQAVGQMILGPLIFGLIYSGTVATFPKAVFNTAAGILILAIVAIFLVQPPLGASKGKKARRDSAEIEVERGRSRVPKDLRMTLSLSAAGEAEGAEEASFGTLVIQVEE
ncbi:hypothetical protein PC9H_009731 [Pleurotus ostreatus]|uniref:Uncharacterized protein n=2 Tax=Pleurotus TaxID=5320 RepID=A0A8H6ZPY3_PLEOS|nr:uncharacterized protein PC9H_009731 [Pleurotus ostreatus]KAF7424424.1 hypothetical protein PC9H_009731 [Pleurotus ostreatus]KAG9224868.1 hypothetical protein CCMSSC00406_0001981 [Pleurotus cornucopiae]KAJ8692627.1 hypothetical protein PTI98_009924 [Pleurotus ostreatus]